MRALFESLHIGPGRLKLLYRASRPTDVVFRTELAAIAVHRGTRIVWMIGPYSDPALAISGWNLCRLVPGVAGCVVYQCASPDSRRQYAPHSSRPGSYAADSRGGVQILVTLRRTNRIHERHMIRSPRCPTMSHPSPGDPATSSRFRGPTGTPLSSPGMRAAAAKVPEITVWFWVAKLLTTGMGETTWDWAAIALGPIPAIGLSGSRVRRGPGTSAPGTALRPWVYWFAVLMVSVFGTTCADAVHVVLGVPYPVSTVVFLVAVLATFGLWYRVERTLSMHSIDTRRRELFYWSAVILTFALGTALGDLTATTLGIGYAGSILIFGVLFVLPFLAGWWTAARAVATFWIA